MASLRLALTGVGSRASIRSDAIWLLRLAPQVDVLNTTCTEAATRATENSPASKRPSGWKEVNAGAARAPAEGKWVRAAMPGHMLQCTIEPVGQRGSNA